MLKLFRFFRPYKKTIALIFILMFLQTLGTLYVPTLTAEIVNKGVVLGDINYIFRTGVLMLIVAALTCVSAVWGSALCANLSSGYCRDVREAIFTKAQYFSINNFNKIGTASMITRSTGDISLIGQSVLMCTQMLLPAPVMAFAGLFLAFAIDPAMAMIIICAMIAFLLVAVILSKKVVGLFKIMQLKMDNINRVLRETVTGVRVIRAFNRETSEKARFDKTAVDYSETSISINKIFAFLFPIIMTIMNISVVAILWFGGIRISNGIMEIGDIMALIEYCFLILYFLTMGMMVFAYVPRASACAERINEVLDLDVEIGDGSNSAKHKIEHAHLEFKNVTFSYPEAEEPILSNISFESKSGEITAIIGGTGSGKSTIVNLIPRFYDVQSGSIIVNGVDIKNMTQNELRDKIGFVPQKAFLFGGTIESNIRYGKEDAKMSEIEYYSKVAQAHDFIMETEKGYKSFVSQGGSNLSGGQKQRLAIARALIRQPEIYIFDDSFSALDFKTDALLRQALKSEVKDSTVIIVAQRVSTIMEADRIIVLDDGNVAGIGTHDYLLQNCEVYRQIAASQMSA